MSPDLRYALRSLLNRPLFSLILISILALGLGANTAMFSVVDSVLLEPLPYPDADKRLVGCDAAVVLAFGLRQGSVRNHARG